MATKYRNLNSKKSSSSSQMAKKLAARTQEIRPVGAWVQPAINNNQDAVNSARQEEQRINQIQVTKEKQLKQFQDEVRRRVAAFDKIKQQDQLDKSIKAAITERNVIVQSATAAEKLTPRKNCCMIRPEAELVINNLISTQGGMVRDNFDTEQVRPFELQTQQVHKLHNLARQSLVTRQISGRGLQQDDDDLPGGIWRSGPTLDRPASRTHVEFCRSDEELFNNEDELKENKKICEPLVVRFEEEPCKELSRNERMARKGTMMISGTDIERVPHLPNLHPGVQTEEERVRSQQQRALYRRLFMDIEREQVKENLRQKEHRKKMAVLKKFKEDERMRIEQLSQMSVEPVDQVTGQTLQESLEMDITHRELSQQSFDEQEKLRRKNKELQRYLIALKQNLKEKIATQNLDLPQLCFCSTNIWETNPNTCANNCIFYRNPKGYAKALQSLLDSCEVL